MTPLHYGRGWGWVFCLLLLVACSSEEVVPGAGSVPEPEQEQEYELNIGVQASVPVYEVVTSPQGGTRSGSPATRTDDPIIVTTTWVPPISYYLYNDDVYGSPLLYKLFEGQEDLTNANIDAFFTKAGITDPEAPNYNYAFHGRLKKNSSDGKWKLALSSSDFPSGSPDPVFESTKYYVYGYVPKSASTGQSTIERLPAPNDDYDKGAKLTIPGLKPVSIYDVCVTIGAREGFRVIPDPVNHPETGIDYDGGWTDTNDNGSYDDGTDTRINRLCPGYFGFAAKGGKNPENYLFLLFDHLYAGLRFSFVVDTKYDELRTIVLKKVEMKSAEPIEKIYSMAVTLTANDTKESPITGDPVIGATDGTKAPSYIPALFNGKNLKAEDYPDANYYPTNPAKLINPYKVKGFPLETVTKTPYIGGFILPDCETDIVLKTTYDIYDKNPTFPDHPEGNLIRKDCTAENLISLKEIFGSLFKAQRGKVYTVNLTVEPTYLYMMSDPDLENPTVKID